MKPLKWKRFKRKMKRFWNEWGITKEQAIDLIGAAFAVIGVPFILSIIGSML